MHHAAVKVLLPACRGEGALRECAQDSVCVSQGISKSSECRRLMLFCFLTENIGSDPPLQKDIGKSGRQLEADGSKTARSSRPTYRRFVCIMKSRDARTTACRRESMTIRPSRLRAQRIIHESLIPFVLSRRLQLWHDVPLHWVHRNDWNRGKGMTLRSAPGSKS
jgi:hypothetical protein